MKKIKYISFSLIALFIGILCISFIPMNKTYAKEYTYEAQIIEDNTFLPDYAITDIEYAKVNGDMCCDFKLVNDTFSDFLWFYSSDKITISNKCKQVIINFDFSNSSYLSSFYGQNFSIFIKSTSYIALYDNSVGIDNVYAFCFWDKTSEYSISFRNSKFGYFGTNLYNSIDNSNFCDFSSSTDTSFNIQNLNNTFWGWLFFLSVGQPYNIEYSYIPSDYIDSFCIIFDTDISYIDCIKTAIRSDIIKSNYNKFTYDYYFDFYELNIGLYRPSYRINNTLIIYNFDYYNGLYSNITYLNYVLRRGNDYYNITYGSTDLTPSDNPLPNSNYLCFYNKDVQNIIFDEFITITAKTRKRINYSIVDNVLFVSAGFDFNFVQYSQPLVASNGSFNYTFDKPDYVDMKFSLAPFYIPVLEMIENAFIFLMFYCPIISDILEFIHLDMFMGGLINVINFIIGGAVGQFILSCIAFIVFFELLRRFMPVVYSAKNDIVEMYHNSNGYKYRQEKKQAKKEWKYQQYKDKQVAKQVNKIKKKMNKKK